ncbi:MAG: hypothetical protein NWQ01_07585 [Ilumatobacteraceae bacterium]|nr:hypothetical protein [Ilumatobacteraceae bacterium]
MAVPATEKVPKVFFGFFAVLLFGLVVADTPIKVALVSTGFIAVQILTGGLIFVALSNKTDLSWQEFCGLGLVIGSLLTIALDQIFRQTFIADYAWVLSLFTMLLIPKSKKFFLSVATQQTQTRTRLTDLLIILAAGFLFISSDWFWALPLVVLIIATVVWCEFAKYRRHAAVAAIISAPISIVSVFTRPNGWWIEDSDLALNEAISQTLKVWGTQENINAVGTPTNYHWLVYAWSGLLERVSGAPNWVMNSRVIPFVVSLGTALLIWAIISRLGYTRKVIFASLLIIGTYDTVPTWGRGFGIGYTPSPSQMYGLLLLLTFVYLVIIFEHSAPKRALILFLIVGIGAIGAKVPHGAIVAASSGLLTVYTILKTRKLFSTSVIQLVVTTLGVFIGFVVIIGGLSDSSRGMIIDQVAFVNGITGDFRPYSLQVRWFAAVIFIFGFFSLPILGIALINKQKIFNNPGLRILLLGVAISGISGAMFLSGEFAVELFFAHAASSLLLVFIAPLLASNFNQAIKSKRLVGLIVGIGLVSAIASAFVPNLNSGSTFAIGLRLIPSLVGLVPISAAVIAAILVSQKTERSTTASRLALFGIAAMSVGFFAVNFSRNAVNEYPEFNRNYESRTGLDRPDLLAASEWITDNTPVAAIFATNDFCAEISTDCDAQTDWLKRVEFSMNCTRDQVLRWVGTDDCNPGSYKLLTALVDRRFLAGNFWVGVSDGDALQPWLAERVMNSVNFAKSASVEVSESLKQSNVEWFLLRKELTVSQDWQKYGTIEYSNDSYAIIKLN